LPQSCTVTPIVAKAALEAMKPMPWSIMNLCLLLWKFPGDTFLVFCRRGRPALIYPDLPCQPVKWFSFISNFFVWIHSQERETFQLAVDIKGETFNWKWVCRFNLSTCQSFCPCANTIYWTAIRAVPVCSSVLVSCFQWCH
jgi:hypothetical protein